MTTDSTPSRARRFMTRAHSIRAWTREQWRAHALTHTAPLPYTERVVSIYAAVLACLLLLIAPAASIAEHEVYYRYTVLGYVTDAAGKQRPRVGVEVVRDR